MRFFLLTSLQKHTHREPHCTNVCVPRALQFPLKYLLIISVMTVLVMMADTFHSRTVSHWRRRKWGEETRKGEEVGEERSIARSHPGITLSLALS